MDIQRGDQVYYRGEVWTVLSVPHNFKPSTHARIARETPSGSGAMALVSLDKLQRVEQVR